MISRTFTLHNASGLHARPASVFVQTASRLHSAVTIQDLDRDGPPVNGKSIIEVLTLGASHGHRIQVSVAGEDEQAGMAELARAIDAGLGESAA